MNEPLFALSAALIGYTKATTDSGIKERKLSFRRDLRVTHLKGTIRSLMFIFPTPPPYALPHEDESVHSSEES